MARYQIFRMYRGDEEQDQNYLFSIIASSTDADYIIPKTRYVKYEAFDRDRIKMLISGLAEEKMPKTPEEWAILAAQNVSENWALLGPTDETDLYDEAVEDELEYGDEVAEKYDEGDVD